MPGTPRVSVYLPTRNRAAWVVEAAESVLAQTMPDFELLIVDDGSTDDTPAQLAALAARDARVRVLRHGTPQGAPAARNFAIAEARGEFVTGIDDDDLMRPGRLESLLGALLRARPEPAFVCSAFVHQRGGRVRTRNAQARRITLDDLLYANVVGNQVLARTAHLRAVGGFDERLVASQDYDLWTRLAADYGAGERISAATYVYREALAPDSISRSARFGEGARQYTAKHRTRMNAAQRRSQRLLHHITAGERLRLAELPRCFAWPTAHWLLQHWFKGWVGQLRR